MYACMHACMHACMYVYIYIIEYFYISHYCILCSGAVAECGISRAMALRLFSEAGSGKLQALTSAEEDRG